MQKSHSMISVVAVLSLMGLCSTAHAQWAVVDVGAITQLITQVSTLKQQLQTAQGQLTQAQQHFQSITGSRGMERLLAGTVRNYLPPDGRRWTTPYSRAARSSALWPRKSGRDRANTILDAARLAQLSPEEPRRSRRRAAPAAMLQVSTSQARGDRQSFQRQFNSSLMPLGCAG
jgi:type IV secretion system protein VirB5